MKTITEKMNTANTIAGLDEQIKNRKNAGNRRFAVTIGDRHDYASEVVSTHRSWRAAQRSLVASQRARGEWHHIWQWDSYINPDGGYVEMQ